MDTSKAIQSPQYQASALPAVKPVQSSLPASSLQQPTSLTSRHALPSLLSGTANTRDAGQPGYGAQATSPRLKPSSPTASDDKKRRNEDVMAAPAVSSGTKRARDGKDGPGGKPSRTDHRNQQESREKPRAKDRESPAQHEAESTAPHPSKRARKASKGIKSGKTPQPNPTNDIPGQAGSLSPRPQTVSTLTLSNGASPEPATASPTIWKPGAQSPRKNSAHRASVTLSPRRNSNASALEPTSPARQTENLPVNKLVAVNTPSSTPVLPNDDFTFSACDSDKEGVIRVVSSADLPRTDGQAVSVPPSHETSVLAPGHGSTSPDQQAARARPGLAPDITALMDELDAALEKPIGM